MKRLVMVLLVVALFAVPASALSLELALVIDGSGSISGANFAAQRAAYHAALDNVIPAHFGDIVLSVWQFSTGVQQEVASTLISDQTALDVVTAGIDAMVQLNGLTAIGSGITAAATDLLGNAFDGDRLVIDVSTDGFSNTGTDPATAATAALAAGIDQVNGLGIGAGANLSWVPAGSFAIFITDFTQLQDALETKLQREITGEIPEPGTFALLGLGLVGLGFGVRRRRRAAA